MNQLSRRPAARRPNDHPRVSLHALREGEDTIAYPELPPGDVRVISGALQAVLLRIDNVEYAIAHYERLLTQLHGERAVLSRRLEVAS